MMVGGILFAGVGTGCYIAAGLGPGPRDGIMTALAARGPAIWLVRTCIEVCALVVGALLGGRVGVGTVLFGFAIGPLAQRSLGVFRLSERPPTVLGFGVTGE